MRSGLLVTGNSWCSKVLGLPRGTLGEEFLRITVADLAKASGRERPRRRAGESHLTENIKGEQVEELVDSKGG